ncbi:MAG: type II CAAX endopeptidase family protein [Planctomycetales bacterium]
MSDPSAESNALEPGGTYVGRGQAWIAWILILALVGLRLASEIVAAQQPAAKGADSLDVSFAIEMQSRFLVGLRQLERRGETQSVGNFYKESLEYLNQGDVNQRLRGIITIGEIEGAGRALGALLELDAKLLLVGMKGNGRPAMSADQKRVREVLLAVYRSVQGNKDPVGEIPKPDQEFLRKQLGWYGDLALVPRGISPWANRESVLRKCEGLVLYAGILVCLLGFWMLLGTFGLLFGLGATASGGLARKFTPGHGAGRIYAETFAVWLLMFAIVGTVAAMYPIPGLELGGQGLAMLGCLWLATLWPWMRGVPAYVIVRDVGLVRGRGIFVESILGIVGYWATLPFLCFGMIVMMILMAAVSIGTPPLDPNSFDPVELPSHPIIRYALGGNPLLLAQMVLLACVFAPLVEETMFRGFLYRHLRDASAGLGILLSVLFSALWNGFVFAAIHPQGWIAIPPLMGIAFGLSLIREWRNSLIPGMVAHGLSNGLVMSLLIVAGR